MYNERGFLTQVNKKQGNLPVWELMEVNSKGQPVETLIGNGLSTYRNYDTYGYLTSVKTGITETTGLVQNYTYQFSPVWGRPEWRNNDFAGQEDFYYDEDGLKLNRLTSVANNTGNTGVTYSANGNIATKTGLGGYEYQLPQPHAVSTVENTGGILPETRQDITYTYFNKAETITEGEKQLLLTYGTANQRVKTEFYNNQILEKTKYFAGNYEFEETPQGTRELHYIAGPMGMAAIFVKENGAEQMYYTHSDHLGSLTEITDNTGTLIQCVVYNAWGQRELLVDNTATEKFLFDRGFTGHEHLDEFALINMNGRMYDPALGVMLSPDNYVQNPYGTQGFHRYSYAGNNPLVYVDPDGNLVWFVPVIAGAVIGGYLGGAIQQGSGGLSGANWNVGSWDNTAWKGITVGALAGAGIGLGVSAGLAAAGANITGISVASQAGFAASGATTTSWNITANALINANINMSSRALQGGNWEQIGVSGLIGLGAGAIGGTIASYSRFSTAATRGAMSTQGISTQNYVTNILSGAGDRFFRSLDADLSAKDVLQNTFWGGMEGAFSAWMFSSDKMLNFGRGLNRANNPVFGRYFSSLLSNSMTSNPGASLMAARIYMSVYPAWKLGKMNDDFSLTPGILPFSGGIYYGLSAIQSSLIGSNYPYAYNFLRP